MTDIEMKQFFIVGNSFAAPFTSDTSIKYVDAVAADSALDAFIISYTHPAGLFAANVYESADDYHKNVAPLATFRATKSPPLEPGTD